MSYQLVECVPNFSEGRNQEIINQITEVIKNTEGIKLLDVDPGPDMNRTVVTFVGPPDKVREAAFKSISKAAELIDMSKHRGSHPRMGATDVCPFVPVTGITTEECIELSKEVARRVGEELNIPVYLYEKSAVKPDRQNLAVIRQGEYEGLEEKLKNPDWKPDYGPTRFNKKSGATVIGVREFLIAYNINLNTREVKYAADIAYELREKGRAVRRPVSKPFYFKGEKVLKYAPGFYPCGNDDFIGKTIGETSDYCLQKYGYNLKELLSINGIDPEHPEGRSVIKPGKFNYCKAIGWMVGKYDRAQISINLTNFKETSMHDVFEAARILADERGLIVTGSEIVGMVPYPALLETGKFYLRKQGRSTGIPVNDILETAVQSLGLRDVAEFNITERVIGLPEDPGGKLTQMRTSEFIYEVSRESPAPGGGSVSALAGALGSALASMVSNLTTGKSDNEDAIRRLVQSAEKCQELIGDLMINITEDTEAFNAYIEARRLPDKTPEEKKFRSEMMLKGLKKAVTVPLNTALKSYEVLRLATLMAIDGNQNSVTDAAVGAQMAFAGIKGGIYNVLINLKEIQDNEFTEKIKNRCRELEADALKELDRLQTHMKSVFG